MNKMLDISIHGPKRVAIVERLMHVCRYEPGLVLLEGEAGKSPVNFLRDMADLLRDELDFALLDSSCTELSDVTSELVRQWFIYQADEGMHSDIQSVHHYLDVGLQSGRLALIVIERSALLADAAINLLISMMARHSRLTVLFAGVVDARPLLRRAQQAEVPVHRIDLPDAAEAMADTRPVRKTGASLSSSQFDHQFSDDSYELPETDEEEELLFASTNITGKDRGRREPLLEPRYEATQSSLRINAADSILGVGRRLSEARAWGVTTLAVIHRKKGGGLLLLSGFLILLVLIALVLVNAKGTGGDMKREAVPPREVLSESSSQTSGQSQAPANTHAATQVVPSRIVEPSASPVAITPAVTPAPTPAPTQTVAREATPVVSTSAPTSRSVDSETATLPAARVKRQQTIPVSKAVEPNGQGVVVLSEKQWRAHPDNYTVQIAGAQSETNINRLAAALPSATPHYVRRTTRDGKPWFVLVFGSFASKQEASAAREALPAAIKAGSAPWVRKQGEIFNH